MSPVAGVDEAGCGPWAGPVVAAAVILFPEKIPAHLLESIQDSKQVVRPKGIFLVEQLSSLGQHSIIWAVGTASVDEIDQLNIRRATFLAMERAVEGLALKPKSILVDGNVKPILPFPTSAIVKGDQKSLSIAAASLFAKVTRDHIMEKLAQDFPVFGWAENAGYGTPHHQQALARHGVTPHHRKTYAPIRRLLEGAPK